MSDRRQRRISGQPSLSALAAFHRVARVVADVTGVPFRDIVANAGPGTMRRPAVRFARCTAIYLTVVHCNVQRQRLARSLGRVRRRIQDACALIEERRDSPDVDALIARMEAMLG